MQIPPRPHTSSSLWRVTPAVRSTSADSELGLRKALLQIAREADRVTHDRATMIALHARLKQLQAPERDATLQTALTLQDALMMGYLGGPMRNPKVIDSADLVDQIYAEHVARATDIFLFECLVGATVLAGQHDDQRCAVNLGADACLLGVDGGIGVAMQRQPAHVGAFLNAVRTSDSDRLVTVQAQGPINGHQVQKLLMAATRHAAQTGCKKVTFVNASPKTIPNFGAAVDSVRARSLPLRYLQIDWTDGEIPQTPRGRAGIVNFASALAADILATDDKTLVVFNCHYGLDRSGVLNALTQVLVDHIKQERHGATAVDTDLEATQKRLLTAAVSVLGNIKVARPHGLSTVFRFRLVMHCLRDIFATPP